MQRLLIRRDTAAWRLQVWASFGAAVLLCVHAAWNLPGESLDRLLVALGLLFVLSASFTLAKTVRDNQHEKVDTAAWVMQVWTAFAISTVLTGWAILRLAVDAWHQGYLAASALFLLSSAFTLAKTVRDEHDASVIDAAQRARAAAAAAASPAPAVAVAEPARSR